MLQYDLSAHLSTSFSPVIVCSPTRQSWRDPLRLIYGAPGVGGFPNRRTAVTPRSSAVHHGDTAWRRQCSGGDGVDQDGVTCQLRLQFDRPATRPATQVAVATGEELGVGQGAEQRQIDWFVSMTFV